MVVLNGRNRMAPAVANIPLIRLATFKVYNTDYWCGGGGGSLYVSKNKLT